MHPRLFSLTFVLLGFAHVTLGAIYVAPHGSSGANGSQSQPTTLSSALARAHEDPGLDEIILLQGRYSLESTLRVQALVRPAGEHLTIRSESADRRALIQGGEPLQGLWSSPDSGDPIVARMPSEARDKVHVADLRAAGITDYGSFRRRGFDGRKAAPGELFVYGRRQIIAGYPNPGQSSGGESDRDGIENGYQKYANASGSSVDLPRSVAQGWNRGDDVWAHGYWGVNWADAHLPVTYAGDGRLELGGRPSTGISDNGAYRVYNLPEELDMPGEWYLHRDSGKLYFWPRTSGELAGATFSMLERPVVRVLRSSNIHFENIVFECGRSDLVHVSDSTGIVFRHCEFRGSGEMGLRLNGERNRVESSHFHNLGDTAVELTGGERDTLFPGANLAVNNVIHNYGQIYFSYSAGIYLDGVGNVAAHNLIHDAPHEGIQINGMLNRVFRNEVHGVCQFIDDGGAIYSGRNFLGWGNRIVENFVHDIETKRTAEDWVHGIYLDDFASGFTVQRNVLENIQAFATNLGGGRYNVIDANLILDSRGGHLNDNRGAKWINTTPGSWWNMIERISRVDRDSDPWKGTFPGLAMVPTVASEAMNYVYPDGTEFTRNAGSGVGEWTHEEDWTSHGGGVFSHYAAFDGKRYGASVSSGANLAQDSSRSDISINTDGIVIPFSRIGLQNDRWESARTTKSSALANFTWTRGTVYSGSPIVLLADNAWSPDRDRIVSRTWSIDGTTIGTGERLTWTPPSARTYRVSLRVVTASGANDRVEHLLVAHGSGARPDTWLGRALAAPGIIQAEFFDRKRYYDTDGHNAGGALRDSGVDLGNRDGTTYVGWTQPDEWLEFTVEANSGTYDLYVRIASRRDNVALSVQWDGEFVAGTVLPNVGNNFNFGRYKVGRINVPHGGLHTLRFDSLGKDFNMDHFELVRVGDAVQPEEAEPADEVTALETPDSTIEPPRDLAMGSALFARYNGIRGDNLDALFNAAAFPDSPNAVDERNSFEFRNGGESFGIYGWAWLVPEKTGYYTFWLSSDNQGVLSLSPGRDSTKAEAIARVTGYTRFRDFDESTQQKSAPVHLEAGKAYYIEAIAKQGWGSAHLSVAWQGPGISRQVIPGRVLGVSTSDSPGAPASAAVSLSGTLTRSANLGQYVDICGDSLARLYDSPKYPENPDKVEAISDFTYWGAGESFGLFAWAWIVPEKTGDYVFWISSDNQGELFLGENGSADSARVIAKVPGYTLYQQFDRFPEQKAAPVRLEAGKVYYIAAAMKQGWGSAHLSVAWQGPGFERQIVPGSVLTADQPN